MKRTNLTLRKKGPLARMASIITLLAFAAVFPSSCAKKKEAKKITAILPPHLSVELLEKRLKVYAPVRITHDEEILSGPERAALKRLVEAAHVMDEIFLRQVWLGNVELREKIDRATSSGSKEAEMLNHFFRINFGPWDRINNNEPFIGDLDKPEGANYYPEDMTKEEFENFLRSHPGEADSFRGFFTTIRRENRSLKAVPYSEEYRSFLEIASRKLMEAADILTNPENTAKFQEGTDYTTLATFLRSRAGAFSSNDYFQSDMDWMDVRDNIIDVTIGPYEVYEDALFGYKAAFEAFIAIRNPQDSQNLEGLKKYLQLMKDNLPIPNEHKNPNRASESPISVVDLVYAGGDTKAGVQTIAFNLPNDERVREAKGSKKVMLKNISQAKFDKILMPIAGELLDLAQVREVDFETYFSNTLMHEFAHGLGPGKIELQGGKKTTVSLELKELYPPIEEAKADILGLYNTALLVKSGFFPKDRARKAYVTFLPGFFRAIRFGIHGAHGRANMIEFNYLRKKGALSFDQEKKKYRVKLDIMPGAVKELTTKLLMIEALGDYEGAKGFIEEYGEMPPEVEQALTRLNSIPVDIEPSYSAASYLKE